MAEYGDATQTFQTTERIAQVAQEALE